MRRSTCVYGVVAAALSGLSGAAHAAVHPIDFFPSGEEVDNLIQLRFLGPTGVTIEQTRLVAEFTTANGFQAENLILLLVAPVGETFIFLTGADLGWEGEGTFSVDMTFDDLNGVTAPGLWGFEVYATEGEPPFYSGKFSDNSRWELHGPDVPTPGALALLTMAGVAAGSRRRGR